MINYKKIFKTSKIRNKVLDFLSFLPDKIMLPIQYRLKLGRKLNLRNPRRFSEKIQWYKMNYRNPLMNQCVDKYLVRDYVEKKGLSDILIPLYGKYDTVEDVEWDKLPDRFVIKTSHGGGGLNVIVCNDKNTLSMDEVRRKLYFKKKPLKKNGAGREWAYYGLMPGIIVEKLLEYRDNPETGIYDYKFLCYNGHAGYIVVDVDRYKGHKRNFYDRDWNNLYITSDCPAADREIPKPENLDEMISAAEKLAGDFPFVRVDLYNVDGKIFFGELTFYPWSGYVQFSPDEWDFTFSEGFDLRSF